MITPIPHELWTVALPRLLAVSYGLALIAALAIRLWFRFSRPHLSYRSAPKGRHAQPSLKSPSNRDDG